MNKIDGVYIGEITGVFGIKGELKVYTESDFVDYRYRKGAKIILVKKSICLEVQISSMRIHKNNVLITINDCHDINQVEQYIGYQVYAPQDDVPPLEEDEYPVDDLIGLQVVDEMENAIGEVEDFIAVPQGYIMEVKTPKGKILFPFVDAYILEIREQQIVVRVLELCQ